MTESKPCWFVYILSCSDGSLYTGITTDLKRRINQHNSEYGGAIYTRGRQPVNLVYFEETPSRSLASKREISIKKLSLAQKRSLIDASQTNIPPHLR